MSSPFIFNHLVHNAGFSVFDTRWIAESAKFVALGAKRDNKGIIKILELNENNVKTIHEITSKTAYKCCTFDVSSMTNSYLSVGDFGGQLEIIDVERPDKHVYKVPKAHKSIINSIDAVANSSGSEIVTGGHDGLIKVWDPRQQSKPAVEIRPAKQTYSDCWSVAFGNSFDANERFVIGAYENSDLSIFDLRTLKPIVNCRAVHAICSMETKNKYGKMQTLVCGASRGHLKVYEFDENWKPTFSNKTIPTKEGKLSTTIWCVRHLPQNPDIFATCDGSGSVRLWNHCMPYYEGFPAFEQIAEFEVGSVAMNSFDWHPDRVGLAVCSSFDKKINIIQAVDIQET